MSGDLDDLPQAAKEAKPGTGDDFPVLPKGNYPALCIKHEVKAMPEVGGKYHQWTFQVLEGEFKNQKQFLNLYFLHPDAQTRAKTNSKYGSLKSAANLPNPSNGSEFVNKPVVLVIDCFPDKQTKELRNSIRNVLPRMTGPATAPQQQVNAPAGAPIAAPWGTPTA
jgi:Protein of unknown function (DUF669)